jgi:hypothetical protein
MSWKNDRRLASRIALSALFLSLPAAPRAQSTTAWATSWAASVQGPYLVGNASAQPDLSAVFPPPDRGARDQSFRLIVRPDIWGTQARLRLSNAFNTQPVTIDDVYVGVQMSGSAVVKGTNQPVTFGRKNAVTIPAGGSAWSDAVPLPFRRPAPDAALAGRKLAVSFHVAGESGPMTWHAKALTTSYVTLPGSGSHGQDEHEEAFRASTTSWYFLDAVDMMAPRGTRVIAAFGDSITDGTASTLNGDDRWPDVLSRRLHTATATRCRSNAGSAATASPAPPSTRRGRRLPAVPRRDSGWSAMCCRSPGSSR